MPKERATVERDEPIQRARRTAAATRIVLGLLGIALIAAQPGLLPHPVLGALGFATIVLTSVVHTLTPRLSWLRFEETFATSAAILIIGLGDQQVTPLSVLWLVAVATGVMARGGRVSGFARFVVLAALAMPILFEGRLAAEYAVFCAATIGLQLTSGRLTLELNRLLRQARRDAESAQTLLLAGDIAARVSHSAGLTGGHRPPAPGPAPTLSPEDQIGARRALAELTDGRGLMMAMQPIVDMESGSIHAYEALARFGRRREDRSPLNWFALAAELGERVALERACLRATLELFALRPPGARVSVNLAAAALLDPATRQLLDDAERDRDAGLHGLIVEITEETLVECDEEIGGAIAALRAQGARLAVDDIGAGYSGLRQITAVQPDYLKLDRSLIAGIDPGDDRAALIGALVGYAAKAGGLLVAEGIEHRSELECLRDLGIPLAQGFFLATPGPPWPGVRPEAAGLLARAGDAAEGERGALAAGLDEPALAAHLAVK